MPTPSNELYRGIPLTQGQLAHTASLKTAAVTELRPTDLAYIAGIIDGEGYVGITKRMPGKNKMRSPKYSARLGISMCDPQAIILLQTMFKVKKNHQKRRRQPETHRECMTLSLENNDARRVIAAVLPYLHIKVEQARIILGLRALQISLSKKLKFRYHMEPSLHPLVKATPVGLLSADYVESCEKLYSQCKYLNRRGPRGLSIWD